MSIFSQTHGQIIGSSELKAEIADQKSAKTDIFPRRFLIIRTKIGVAVLVVCIDVIRSVYLHEQHQKINRL